MIDWVTGRSGYRRQGWKLRRRWILGRLARDGALQRATSLEHRRRWALQTDREEERHSGSPRNPREDRQLLRLSSWIWWERFGSGSSLSGSTISVLNPWKTVEPHIHKGIDYRDRALDVVEKVEMADDTVSVDLKVWGWLKLTGMMEKRRDPRRSRIRCPRLRNEDTSGGND